MIRLINLKYEKQKEEMKHKTLERIVSSNLNQYFIYDANNMSILIVSVKHLHINYQVILIIIIINDTQSTNLFTIHIMLCLLISFKIFSFNLLENIISIDLTCSLRFFFLSNQPVIYN